jgi:hypothetical protein
MFKKSQGATNFERCQLKTVSGIPGRLDQARLDCPMTGPEGFITDASNSRTNLSHLADVAAKTLCGSCVFAGMTRDEYNHQRAADAESEALRLRAEHELRLLRMQLDADTARAEAELAQQLDPGTAPQIEGTLAAELPPSAPPAES